MKKGRWTLLLAALALTLPLSGCAALLERSYGEVEPYADRYWDSGAEDTLRAENYQDLINTLLMLVEQRAETGTIRGYSNLRTAVQGSAAAWEVRYETPLGAYLLNTITCAYEPGPSYCTLTYQMTYREGTEDIDNIMTLSDSQSLVDLLRLAVREEHEKMTAQFVYGTPREDVTAAVESLWQELCQDELDRQTPPEETGGEPDTQMSEEEQEPEKTEETPDEPEETTETPDEADAGEDLPPEVVYPPCPWRVRFYPNRRMTELVEIWLEPS